jgi:ubiquitin-associated and SH3 domain-containing protein
MEQVRWNSSNSSNSKRVVIFRHGERIDIVFGYPSSWADICFDENKKYKKCNLNMPDDLPERPFEDWKNDGPLTKVGEFQAHLVGTELKKNNVNFTSVYVSPAYRCLKTAQCILKAMDYELPMKVEYGLFEWLGFCLRYKTGFPKFMSIDEMKKSFNIDMTYEPLMSCDDLEKQIEETFEDLYNRNSSIMRKILDDSEGDILVVAHGMTIDTSTRQLLGKEPRPYDEFKELLQHAPFLVSSAVEKDDHSNYKLIEPPCFPMTNTRSPPFDWKNL